MDRVAALTNQERSELFELTSSKMNLPGAAVEKDFWVCWVLKQLFGSTELSPQLLFKGGTSLSKCYGLIERFSEDIDLILDWEKLTDEDPYEIRSNTKQDLFNKDMKALAEGYVKDTLLPLLQSELGQICNASIHPDRAGSITIDFPGSFESDYIKPSIELEIGPMSAMIPHSDVRIKPYCADVAPQLFSEPTTQVRAIDAKKTFWDKVTILHVEAHRPEDKQQQAWYSRHYYDLYQMINSEIRNEAMNDVDLLKTTFEFKKKFYPQGWANYKAAVAGEIKLTPAAYLSAILERDYAQMEEMIFGDYPRFTDIMQTISQFESELIEAVRKS